jgi:hypothetical protein
MVTVLPLYSPKPAVEIDDEYYPRMVSFERADGSSKALCDRDLERLDFDPPDAIKVRFATGTVVIRGLHLEPVWQALSAQRAVVVREARPGEDALRETDEPHIDGITVVPQPVQT